MSTEQQPTIGSVAIEDQAQPAALYPSYVVIHGADEPDGPYLDQTAPTMNPGNAVRVIVGAGNSYYIYTQDGLGFDWWNGFAVDDWTEASVCSTSILTNNSDIAAQLANPSTKVHAP